MTLDTNCEERNLDSFARGMFLFLITCSLLNDTFNIYKSITENKIVKNNMDYFKDLSDAFVGILSNKEKKIKEGVIIKTNNKSEEKKINEKTNEKPNEKENKNNGIKKKMYKNTLMDEIKDK